MSLFRRYRTWPGRGLFILSCLCLLVAAAGWLFGIVGNQKVAGMILGTGVPQKQPVRVMKDGVPPGQLSAVAANDESVFLLYETAAVVRAFSHDGSFQYTLMFPNSQSHSGKLYAMADMLYYHQISWRGLWVMKGGAFEENVLRSDEEYDALLATLQTENPEHRKDSCTYGDVLYRIEGQDVVRTDADGTFETFVDGPEFLGLLESFPVWCVTMGGFLLAAGIWIASLMVERRIAQRK